MKIAAVDVTTGIFILCSSILEDAGLHIVGSLDSERESTLRLVIEGDSLPDECSSGEIKKVSIKFHSEVYGQQRLHRVSEISLA